MNHARTVHIGQVINMINAFAYPNTLSVQCNMIIFCYYPVIFVYSGHYLFVPLVIEVHSTYSLHCGHDLYFNFTGNYRNENMLLYFITYPR